MYTNEKGILRIYGNITGPIDDTISTLTAFKDLYNLTTCINELILLMNNENENYHRYYMSINNKSSFIPAENRLIISRINFNSDGKFDLLGIAHILKQIREFIKDISYRNSIEKYEGRFELLMKINDSSLSTEEKQLLKSKIYRPLKKIKRDFEFGKINDIEFNPKD